MDLTPQVIAGAVLVVVAFGSYVPGWLAAGKGWLAKRRTPDAPESESRWAVVEDLLPLGERVDSLGIPTASTAFSSLVNELMKGQPKS